MRFAINQFVRRQTAASQYSHFVGDEAALLALLEAHFAEAKPGYRDGVLLVPVPAEGFFSGVITVTPETELKALFAARQKGEAPYLQVLAVGGEKLPAKKVDLVIYRNDVLGKDASEPESEWELVSINASCEEGDQPLTPMAMARNFLNLPGGTAAVYTAEQFAEAIIYWSTRAMRG